MMSLLYSKLFHLHPEEVIIRGERRVIEVYHIIIK